MFDRDHTFEEARLDVSHLAAGQETRPQQQPRVERDLTGKAKALMAIGAGATGKTTLLRWVCEQALLRDSGAGVILATVDPINRELGQYFPTAVAPKSSDPCPGHGMARAAPDHADGGQPECRDRLRRRRYQS